MPNRVPLEFAKYQTLVLQGMGELVAFGLLPNFLRGPAPTPPSDWAERVFPPPPDELVDAYVEHVGADPARYTDCVPPHFFPQWAFAMTGGLLRGLRYPLLRAVNGGCRLETRADLPRGRALIVRGRLASVEDDGRRALIVTRFTTGVEGMTKLMSAEMRVVIPLARGSSGEKKSPPRVDPEAHELYREKLSRDAGREFALLTGDFNPIHVAPLYAKASGFPNVILHGFGTFARAWEAAAREAPISVLDGRFTRPVVLPNELRVLGSGERVWVVDAHENVVMEGRVER